MNKNKSILKEKVVLQEEKITDLSKLIEKIDCSNNNDMDQSNGVDGGKFSSRSMTGLIISPRGNLT